MLRRLIAPTKTRARIFDRDGGLILDSRNLFARGDVHALRTAAASADKPNIFERAVIGMRTWLNRGDLPLYREFGPEGGRGYREVSQSLDGQKQHGARHRARRGHRLGRRAGAAFPRRAWRADADDAGRRHRPDVTAERLAILKVGGVAAAV